MPDRLSNLRIVDPVLTNLVRGYRNAAFVGEMLFPVVPVPKEKAIIPVFGKEAFKIYDTERALRANSNEIKPEGLTTTTLATQEHDLSYPVDYRETQEAEFNPMRHAARTVADLMALEREYTAASLAQNPASYDADHKLDVSTKWSVHDTADPLNDIKTAMGAVRDSIGRFPNTIVMGWDAYRHLCECQAILERIKYAQRAIITVDLIKAMLELPDNTKFDIGIGLGVYTTNGQKFTNIWGGTAIVAYVSKLSERQRSEYDPSYGYMFRRKKYPFADKYTKAGGKITYVRNTDNYEIKIVGAEAGFLLYDLV